MSKVEIVSRETIKPSSPTPENLLYLQLSLLDQLAPTMHTPLILFYSAGENTQKSDQLKKSLSDVLMRFYPFAGRIKEDDGSGYIHVECNDEGVEFYEARVDGGLSEFSTTESSRLLPPLESPSVPLQIQLSVFNCGGIAIAVYLSHQISDGFSLTAFIKNWADASRIGYKTVSPTFGFVSLFPPRSMKRSKASEFFTSKEKTSMKRLVFSASKIALLKEKVSANSGFSPTRVEAVSALIWRCVLRTRGVEGIKKKPMATHSVNIRKKMEPPLPEYPIGNMVLPAFAFGEWDVGDRNNDRLGYLEGRLREAVGKVGSTDYAREKLKGDGDTVLSELLGFFSSEKWEKVGIDCLFFNSWCGFPLYESDFGWGKPEQLGFFTSTTIKNFVFLLPTRDEGIEARITIEEDEMERFEQDPELLVFVS